MIINSRCAAYSDEAGDDPASSLDTLLSCGFRHVCLRQLWTSNILDASDQAIRKVKLLLDHRQMSVALIATELGGVPVRELSSIPVAKLDRAFHLAEYYGAPLIRFRTGKSSGVGADTYGDYSDWLAEIEQRAIRANVTPLLEPTPDQSVYKAQDVADVLSKHPRWQLLYDPAGICLRSRVDPLVSYWMPLSNRIAAFDIRDLEIGNAFRPVGHGDCRVTDALAQAGTGNYTGWFFLEPGLGRRYGGCLTKRDTFVLAASALTDLRLTDAY